MKKLIVNADDLGASHGINRAIYDCYHEGIVTSASLMVDMPAASEAVELSNSCSNISIGLHTVLTSEDCSLTISTSEPIKIRAEITRQIERFEHLLGYLPSHIDAHHNIYREPELTPIFIEIANQYSIPLREHSSIRYFSSFYGQWEGGVTHLEWISTENLVRMLEGEIDDGLTELSCHPGYVGDGFKSSYLMEREFEVKTLCDSKLPEILASLEIQLINYFEPGLCRFNR
jgi:predicted glycoside hydrolase/deacetylase ChbG (UPF0249 family)